MTKLLSAQHVEQQRFDFDGTQIEQMLQRFLFHFLGGCLGTFEGRGSIRFTCDAEFSHHGLNDQADTNPQHLKDAKIGFDTASRIESMLDDVC